MLFEITRANHTFRTVVLAHAVLFILACCWPLGVLVASDQNTDEYLTSDKRSRLMAAQEQMLNGEFASAQAILDSLVSDYPDDPLGYMYKAAVYMAEMTDAEENLYPHEFKTLIDATVSLSSVGLEKADSPHEVAWMKLSEGHAHANNALWESRFGSFTSALKQAFEARSCYEDGLSADITLYDLYAGLGMFHYWKSAKAGVLRWIGLFKNEKDKGIAELRLAVDSSLVSSQMARNALIWIWLDKKEYDSVVTICQAMLEKFPHGKVYLWPLAEAYFKTERYDLAAETYQALRKKLAESPGNYRNLIECDYNLNRCYDKLDLDELAILAARPVEDYYNLIPDDTKRRQRSKLDFLRRVAKRTP
ncbi:MAG: hypothetical protein JSV52_00385 [Candidatus Zixiibacteriota bacterium]|nr:MAG: hypothetical protein JSV52_00385 [candidate division Zixibacteria bacterium]